MKFNLKLFVVVGVLAGFRDVCGTEKEVKNEDYDGFIVAELEGNENEEKKWELEKAIGESSVIKAVYKAEFGGGKVPIIHENFKDELSKVLVCAGKAVYEIGINDLVVDEYGNTCYNMKKNVEYTVYFIFKAGGVESTTDMFFDCSSLISADFRFFNTTNVNNMSYMFFKCSSLTELNLSSFDTKNVTNMSNMFYECIALTKLDLSSFDTKNVTNMSWMFVSCLSLKELNLSNFDTTNVKDMSYMFSGCSSLKTVFLPSKNARRKKRCICCGDEYVCWNNHEVGGLKPEIMVHK